MSARSGENCHMSYCACPGVKYHAICQMPQIKPSSSVAFVKPYLTNSRSRAKPRHPNSSFNGPESRDTIRIKGQYNGF